MRNYILVLAILASPALADDLPSAAQEAVMKKMGDPASVQFRNIVELEIGPSNRYCGEVNFKNESGQYVGYQYFMVEERNGVWNALVGLYGQTYCETRLKALQ